MANRGLGRTTEGGGTDGDGPVAASGGPASGEETPNTATGSTPPESGRAVRVVTAAEFEAECRALVDGVAAGRGEIVITRNGEPVSRLVPVEIPKSAPIGRYRDRVRIVGDIVAPVEVEWEAETNPERVLDPRSGP